MSSTFQIADEIYDSPTGILTGDSPADYTVLRVIEVGGYSFAAVQHKARIGIDVIGPEPDQLHSDVLSSVHELDMWVKEYYPS